MAQQQSSALAETWQQWEGRVVNGRYPLGQYLGDAKQSAVYVTKTSEARAAIKLVAARPGEAQDQLTRWELARRLSHPHLIRILDVGRWHADDEQDMLFAVMEYADENLSESRRALTASEARQMLEPTLDALRYLHAQGLVHGRLCPANVMAVGEQLKLSSDSVRRMGRADAPLAASSVYDAPERKNGVLAPSGDIWSLGVLLVQALTNRVPEHDKIVKLPENLPAPFDEIVKHCLEGDPEKRWSAAEIKKRLEQPAVKAQPGLLEPSSYLHAAEDKKLDLLRQPSPSGQNAARLRPAAASGKPAAALAGALPEKKRVMVLAAAIFAVLLAVVSVISFAKRGVERQPPASSAASAAATASAGNTALGVPPAGPAASGGNAAVLHEVLPDVPRRARNSINGTVKVRVKVAVDPSGKVSHSTLVARGPSGYFAQHALQAARQWSFVAPQVHGQPAGSEWSLTFEFRKSGTRASAQRVS